MAPDTHVEHPYYQPEPGSAWDQVEQWQPLLVMKEPLVSLANWQEPHNVRWSFQHMRELMPSAVIHGNDNPRPLPERHFDLDGLETELEWAPSVADLLRATQTDGFLVMHHGRIVTEQYTPPMVRRTRHLVMSVSKSIVSCVAGSLAGDGLLDPEAPAERYVPELAGCGYAGRTVRDILDMRSGVQFSEAYLDPMSEVRVMERSMGWAPRNHGDPLGMYPYILSIAAQEERGGVFEYRSIDTDVLGWICERAADARMADLISERIWEPIGAFHDAEVTLDPLATAIHDGGVSTTLRDLARFGLMIAADGAVGERQVVPAEWMHTACYPPADVREAFAASDNEPYLTGGWYRNQFWFVPGDNGPIQLALGIHGQMVFVERSTGIVAVKLSSWQLPQDPTKLLGTIWALRQIGRVLDSES
ncbi:hypothetical protein BJY21_000281 [Kineosphaera limosa]|uniref:6-aminohexanoate-dimer hydrolase n=1 Tax=Kineosphaera limosa NBRC 100340 TaxID=1184609 RepID=K6VJY8_9MICO|nr:serine hydrolase [Kineosphaera limosa]NYD99096.1 hypothetical protein [Kineosphaera limosa]GAB96543.1 6-aminohexanoate-dimer hydrolase [Kineosphaera limosa NBRC 100340]